MVKLDLSALKRALKGWLTTSGLKFEPKAVCRAGRPQKIRANAVISLLARPRLTIF